MCNAPLIVSTVLLTILLTIRDTPLRSESFRGHTPSVFSFVARKALSSEEFLGAGWFKLPLVGLTVLWIILSTLNSKGLFDRSFDHSFDYEAGCGDGRTLEAEYALEGGEALNPFF